MTRERYEKADNQTSGLSDEERRFHRGLQKVKPERRRTRMMPSDVPQLLETMILIAESQAQRISFLETAVQQQHRRIETLENRTRGKRKTARDVWKENRAVELPEGYRVNRAPKPTFEFPPVVSESQNVGEQ